MMKIPIFIWICGSCIRAEIIKTRLKVYGYTVYAIKIPRVWVAYDFFYPISVFHRKFGNIFLHSSLFEILIFRITFGKKNIYLYIYDDDFNKLKDELLVENTLRFSVHCNYWNIFRISINRRITIRINKHHQDYYKYLINML